MESDIGSEFKITSQVLLTFSAADTQGRHKDRKGRSACPSLSPRDVFAPSTIRSEQRRSLEVHCVDQRQSLRTCDEDDDREPTLLCHSVIHSLHMLMLITITTCSSALEKPNSLYYIHTSSFISDTSPYILKISKSIVSKKSLKLARCL